MSDNITKRVGLGTAYGFAKAGGYEGTVAEFTELLGNIAIDLARIENLSVTVTTLPAGSQATASLNGSVLSLGIPKGDKGDKGNTGNTPDFGIGTVTTLSAGSSATASITGTAEAPVLNLGIPEGQAGSGAVGTVASAYSASKTYAVGDYVIHNSNLYRCTTAITTAEAFTAAHWTPVVLGDDVSDLKSDIDTIDNLIIKSPTNYAESFLQNTPITRSGENATIAIDGDAISYSNSSLDADKWVAFPVDNVLPTGKTYAVSVSFEDASNIDEVRISAFVTDSSTGYTGKTFTKNGNTFTLNNWQFNESANTRYLLIYMNRGTTSFDASVSCLADGEAVELKPQIIGRENLKNSLSETIIPAKNTNTNLFLGANAGENTVESASDDGKYNTAVGVRAMKANTSGDHCTAVGFQAMQKNTTGDGNTALGEDALYENTTGGSNTAIGSHALQSCTGDGNTAVGSSALIANTTGFFNTVVGGYNAGDTIETGSRNTLVGAGADVVSEDLNDTIVLGMTAAKAEGQIRIGSIRATELVIVFDNIAHKVVFNSDGTLTWETVL